jgi:hypothetical protein
LWCPIGAIERVLGTENSAVGADAIDALRSVLPIPETGADGDDGCILGSVSISSGNDASERTVAEVVAKLHEAAEAGATP